MFEVGAQKVWYCNSVLQETWWFPQFVFEFGYRKPLPAVNRQTHRIRTCSTGSMTCPKLNFAISHPELCEGLLNTCGWYIIFVGLTDESHWQVCFVQWGWHDQSDVQSSEGGKMFLTYVQMRKALSWDFRSEYVPKNFWFCHGYDGSFKCHNWWCHGTPPSKLQLMPEVLMSNVIFIICHVV